MVPFDVMGGRNSMVCNSRGVTGLCKSFEMLGLPIMQSSFCLTDVEGITVPTTVFVYYFRYYTILYYTILYYTILYYTILYYTILYYTILYYVYVAAYETSSVK